MHLDGLIDKIHVQHVGDESRTDALNLVRARLERLTRRRLGQYRALGRLDGDGLNRWLEGLQCAGQTGNRAASTYAGNDDINRSVSVAPDFLGSGLLMHGRVGRVLELLEHHCARGLASKFIGPIYRTLHAAGGRGKYQLGPHSQ